MNRILVALTMLVAGCAQQQHEVLVKSDGSLSYAQSDLIACKHDADTRSGGGILDNGYRNNIISQCLQAKGYHVTVESGPCVNNCVDKANEFRPNNGQVNTKPLVNPNEQVKWVP